jgi:hypothetical protein
MVSEMKDGFKRQMLLNFGIIFVAIAAATVGLYVLSGDLAAQAQKIIVDKALINKQTAILGILANLKSDAPVAARYADAMKKLLPIHDDLINFPQWLTALGRAHDVSVSFSFRGDNTAATDAVAGTDGFTLGASGSATNLIAFLQDLEVKASGFLLSIDTFDLVGDSGGYRLSAQGRLFSR